MAQTLKPAAEMIAVDREHRLYGRMRFTVTVDPAPSQFKWLLMAARKRQLRGTAAAGRIWLWPAYDGTHSVAREALGIAEPWGDFWIIRDGDDPLSDDWMVMPDDPRRNGMVLLPGHPKTRAKPEMQAVLAWFAARPTPSTSSNIERLIAISRQTPE